VTSDKTSVHRAEPADFSGILVLDKPLGLTSMTAVAAVRRRAGGVRTGHAGTLDPLATGVLVMALGKATRSIERLMATDKRYLTEIDLSAFTATDDREGERTEIMVDRPPDEATVRAALEPFIGTIAQRPPAFSAMKVGGRRAYAAARRGTPIELAPRPVRVDSIELVSYRWPLVTLDIRCGKGFYVRSLARDLGQALGTGGHCASIRRTAVGPFVIAEARPLDSLPPRLEPSDLLPLADALARLGGPT
jgi:tRNA pseudouridine55 synthase